MSDSLPADWEASSLGGVAKWGSGGTPKSGNAEFYGGPIKWAVIGDLTESWVSETAQSITELGLEKSSAKVVSPGTVMLAMYGASIGRTGIAEVEMATNQAIAFAVPIDGVLDAQYLLKYLQSQKEDFVRAGQGGAQPNISQTVIKPWPIPLPPIAEQVKIVEILEEQFSRLDAALASVRAVRQKSARFRRSLLNSIFENQFLKYGDSSIEEMLEVLPSGRKLDQGWSPQCLRQSVENNEDWGVLITTAVQHGSFNWKENKLLPATMAPRPAIELKNGDFLMTRLGPRPRCGVACMVRETRGQLMVPDKMYRFRPNQLVLEANFLNIFITSPQFLDAIEVLKTGTSESGMNITQSRFLAVKVPRTPISEQIEIASDIAAQLSRLEASLAIADAIEKKASALRRSLLHAAFSGNLTKEWREAAYV